MAPIKNVAAKDAPFYTPAQDPPAGTALDPSAAPTLFQPLTIRGMTLQNRFVVSPMCQYSADDGHLTDWHFAHLSQFMIHGAALTIVEASAVLANGRITPQDAGLWKDSQRAPLKRIVEFAHSQNQKIGIQLAHAGRKASTVAPWLAPKNPGSAVAAKEEGGWEDNVWAPSAIRYAEGYVEPKAMTLEDIAALVSAFKDAANRAADVGFDCIEIHGAHGYLITEFLSPLSNQRTDKYGGSFENRTRLLFEVVEGMYSPCRIPKSLFLDLSPAFFQLPDSKANISTAVRSVIPESMPIFLRISATEWMEWADEPSWDVEQSIRLAKLLPAAGVDLLDVSSAANNAKQKINLHPYYQVDLAGRIREELKKEKSDLLIGAVGMITNAEMARSIVQEGKNEESGMSIHDTVEVAEESGQTTQADLVLMARQFLREPEFPLRVAHQLNVDVKWPNQYHRGGWKKGAKI